MSDEPWTLNHDPHIWRQHEARPDLRDFVGEHAPYERPYLAKAVRP